MDDIQEISNNSRKQLPDGPVRLVIQMHDMGMKMDIVIVYGEKYKIYNVNVPAPLDVEHIAYGIKEKGWDECVKTGFWVRGGEADERT